MDRHKWATEAGILVGVDRGGVAPGVEAAPAVPEPAGALDEVRGRLARLEIAKETAAFRTDIERIIALERAVLQLGDQFGYRLDKVEAIRKHVAETSKE